MPVNARARRHDLKLLKWQNLVMYVEGDQRHPSSGGRDRAALAPLLCWGSVRTLTHPCHDARPDHARRTAAPAG